MAATDANGNPSGVVTNELIESAWGNSVRDRVVRTVPNNNALSTINAVNGTLAATADNGWLFQRIGANWTLMQASTYSTPYSLGAFPAGSYSYPATAAGIGSYLPPAGLFSGNAVVYSGVYTVTMTLQMTPGDGGDVNLNLWMPGPPTMVSTTQPHQGSCSVSGTAYVPAGGIIYWSMLKNTNTSSWSASNIAFNVAYRGK
jgi:hypothetical protein